MEGKEFTARSFSQQITSYKKRSIGKERAILRWLNVKQWRRQGGGGGTGGSRLPLNDFQNRLLHSSKFGDEKEACAGGGAKIFK